MALYDDKPSLGQKLRALMLLAGVFAIGYGLIRLAMPRAQYEPIIFGLAVVYLVAYYWERAIIRKKQ